MKPLLASLTCLILGAGGVVVGQATFRGDIRTVAIYATVTDAEGRLVTDLDRSAFEIEDNGKRQSLTVFASDLQPITVVLLIDRSTSMRGNFELVREAAERFVAELRPGDKARIGSFSNRIQVDPRDFTGSRDELVAILRNELQDEGPTPLWNAVNVGITSLVHQEGRRVVLVFTDGVDAPLKVTPSNSDLKSVMKRAEAENVMVYGIGLAANSGGPTGAFPVPGGGGGVGPGVGPGRVGGRRSGGRRGRSNAQARAKSRPDPGLSKLAAATGGGYFELATTDDLASTFARVAEELHHQYLLGFSPTIHDGKVHRLVVRSKDARTTVRARQTYLAASER